MTSRSRAQAHAKRAHFCTCGRIVQGTGAKREHRMDHQNRRDGHHWITDEACRWAEHAVDSGDLWLP